MPATPYALLVFDLDGTLVDSRRDLADSANALLAEHGAMPLPVDAVARMVGEGARVLIERAFAAAGLGAPPSTALPRFLELYDERLDVHTRPYHGVGAMLEAVAARCAIALLTNKPQRPTESLIARLGLDAVPWQHVIGGDAAFARKPDPAGLRWLVQEAGATPATTLMVGDSRIDLEVARHAGTGLCLARYGFGFPQIDVALIQHDDHVVDRSAQIADLVHGQSR